MNEEAQSDLLQEHEVLFLDFMGCDNDRLFIDTDGKRCLDYIGEMMLLAENQQGDARVWARQSLAEIEATINALTGSGRTNKAAKWVYFKDKLRYAMETWS